MVLSDKRLVQYNPGSMTLPPPGCAAADKVCTLMDRRTRQVLEAISTSHYLGLSPNSLNCILDRDDSPPGQAAASSLDISQYWKPTQSHLFACPNEGHIDRGLLTLIWSDSTSGLQVVGPHGDLGDVKFPEGYMLVLTGYTLEHVTSGIFKAASHNVALSDQATNRLSFAYKLRSPDNAVLHQFYNLSASGKDHMCTREISASELRTQFYEHHVSIHQQTDLVWMGLSPEWQHSVNEWRTTRHPVDADWIWHKMISTMGWQRPDMTIYFRTLAGKTGSLYVHSTWKGAGVESLLEVLHGIGPTYDLRMICGPCVVLKHSASLREAGVSKGCTIVLMLMLRGD